VVTIVYAFYLSYLRIISANSYRNLTSRKCQHISESLPRQRGRSLVTGQVVPMPAWWTGCPTRNGGGFS